MHPALKIPEIISNVCHHLNPDDTCEDSDGLTAPKPKNCCSLSAFARTCKLLQDPALNKLWSHQNSFIPLVLCLPKKAYKVTTKEINNQEVSTVTVKYHLAPNDYTRFKFYAQRIKSFNDDVRLPICIRGNLYKCNSQVLPILLLCKPDDNQLLPKVLNTTLREISFESLAVTPRSLVGSHLKSIHIKGAKVKKERPWDNIVAILSPNAANIECFVYDHSDIAIPRPRKETDMLRLDRLYRGFRNLRRFKSRIGDISNATIHHLAALPALQQLDIVLDNLQLFQTDQLVPPNALHFREVKDLRLTTFQLGSASLFLSWIELGNLESFSIEWYRDDETGIKRFLTVLEEHHRDSPLKSLFLYSKNSDIVSNEDQLPLDAMLTTALTPLLSFHGISTLIVTPCESTFLQVDNAMLQSIAVAWPNLHTLVLADEICSKPGVNLSRVTLRGLFPLLILCSKLKRLEIRFDINKVPNYAEFNSKSFSGSPLEELHVFYSTIHDAERVATFLTLTFPRLRKLSHSWGTNSQGDDASWAIEKMWAYRWRTVKKLLKPLLDSHQQIYG